MVTSNRPTLVVVGTGMAGARLVEEVIERAPDAVNIRMFGAERHGTYNRILLSTVLGGFQEPSRLWLNPLEWYEERGVGVHAGVKADHIDRDQRTVVGAGGKVVEPYDHLVIATGSRPFVPPLEGTDLKGVFVFRTLEDCSAISAYAEDCERAVVLGGGLLGLEAARGLVAYDLDVTVVELAPRLMVQQLDTNGAALLRSKLEGIGLQVKLNTQTARLVGDDNGRVRGVQLQDGSIIETDMVVVSCGIRPNIELARDAGLNVERAIVVDDRLRTNDESIFAVGECAQHRGKTYGLVDPVYDQARVLADILTDNASTSVYVGSRLATNLKVMGVDLTVMGEVNEAVPEAEVLTHYDASRGVYKKVVVRDNRLIGSILLGMPDPGGRFVRLFKSGEELAGEALELLHFSERDALLAGGDSDGLANQPDDTQICNCHAVSKGKIVSAIKAGKCSVDLIGDECKAGTGCGTCQPLLGQLIDCYATPGADRPKNKVEVCKDEKNGLDSLADIQRLASTNNWREMTDADKNRFKWHGLFFRVPTPGNFMLRLRFEAGRSNSKQFRTLADLSDQYGKGFCDLTTRQQVQLRWFTLADVDDIWRRLEEVGLHSRQTGMDNIRGVAGCPVAGLTPHELFDASSVVEEYSRFIVDNREFTNLPRKFNVTITGCLENCCHTETQDLSLVPAFRELEGTQVNGFNVLVGGKQGSGGYTPASSLDVFVRPEEGAMLCAEITRIFRDHGTRHARTKARLRFLIDERGLGWFRSELQRRWGKPLLNAGVDLRKKHHADHLGIVEQKHSALDPGPRLHHIGFLVPVGRITTDQLRAVADLADSYGTGDIRITVGQNLVVPNIPESRIGALADEPIFKELPFDPSPIMRGLVACTGNDYCQMALIDTKNYAVEVARELEKRTEGRKLQPLTMHWSGCPAGCGLHQVATIGLQGCRSRVNGQVVDAAHVSVNGRAGPEPIVASDIMYDVPCERLAEALEPLVSYLPRV